MGRTLNRLTSFAALVGLGGAFATWWYWLAPRNPPATMSQPEAGLAESACSIRNDDYRGAASHESSPAAQRRLLGEWIAALDHRDIGALLERLQQTTDDETRGELNRLLLTNWAELDLVGMAAWFGQRAAADGLHQDGRDVLVRTLSAVAPQEALAWLAQVFPQALSRELYAPYFREMARRDPLTAAATLDSLRQNPNSNALLWDDLVGQVAGQWAGSDVKRAVTWVQSLPDDSAKASALMQLSEQWMEQDPVAAAAYAAAQSDAPFAARIAMIQAEKDPAAALSWAKSLPAGAARDQATAATVEVYAQQDLPAAEAAVWKLPPGEGQNQAWLKIIESWAEESPADAILLLEVLPSGIIKNRAAAQVAGIWSLHDPEEADQWLRTLPNGSQRDAAINSFTVTVASIAPEYTFRWASCIGGDALRNQSLEGAALAWLQADPAAAGASILQSTLPQAIQAQLLASVDISSRGKEGQAP